MSMIRLRVGVAVVAVCAVLALGGFGGSGGSGGSKAKTEAQRFLNELDKAVREGNTDFRVGRLHPAVIERYGEQQCRDFLAMQVDKTRRDRVKRVGKPESFEYATDSDTVTIPDSIPVQVRNTSKGKKGDRNLHLARVNGQLAYFIDCGTPLARQ
jgi:hypothetical protein